MNCAQCGSPLSSDVLYCSRCGAAVAAPSVPVAQPAMAQALSGPTVPGTAPAPSRSSALAIASLIFGALSWMTLPVVGAIAAVVTGHLAKSEIERSGGLLGGREFATVGLILGYVQLGLVLFGAILLMMVLILGIRLSGISL